MDLVIQSPDSSKRKDSLPRRQCSRISPLQKLSEQSTFNITNSSWGIMHPMINQQKGKSPFPHLFTTPQLLWGWLRILLGLGYCSASPFAQSCFHPLLHRCWHQEYFLVNILHSDLCLRVCFLEDRATLLPHPINHKILLILASERLCLYQQSVVLLQSQAPRMAAILCWWPFTSNPLPYVQSSMLRIPLELCQPTYWSLLLVEKESDLWNPCGLVSAVFL